MNWMYWSQPKTQSSHKKKRKAKGKKKKKKKKKKKVEQPDHDSDSEAHDHEPKILELKVDKKSRSIEGNGFALCSPVMDKNSGIYFADFFIKVKKSIRIGIGIEEKMSKLKHRNGQGLN